MNDQPNEIQEMTDQISSIFKNTLATLIEKRDSRYAEAIAPLEAERETLTVEYNDILTAAHNLEKLLPAKAREAQRKADELLLAGKDKEAEAKLAEAEQATNAPDAMAYRRQKINDRIEAIGHEMRDAAKRIFNEDYPLAQQVVRAAECGVFCTLLDGLVASFYDFQTRTNTGPSADQKETAMVRQFNLSNLTAPERSAEWRSSQTWYGGSR